MSDKLPKQIRSWLNSDSSKGSTTLRPHSELSATPGSAHWRDISTLDRTTMDFVLVTEDGAVRLHLWNPHRNCWERAYPIGSIIQDGEDCSNPTHWMPCPDAPKNSPGKPEGVITSPPATCSCNSQGIYCTPEYNVKHGKATLKKMLRRGYDGYGYGGFHCHLCKKHSPMPHEAGCTNEKLSDGGPVASDCK